MRFPLLCYNLFMKYLPRISSPIITKRQWLVDAQSKACVLLSFSTNHAGKSTWHRAKSFHKTSSPPKPWYQGLKRNAAVITTMASFFFKRHQHQRGMCPFHYVPPRPLDKKRIWWVRPVCNFNRTKEYGSFTIRTQWKGGEIVEGKVLRMYGSPNGSPISSICPSHLGKIDLIAK